MADSCPEDGTNPPLEACTESDAGDLASVDTVQHDHDHGVCQIPLETCNLDDAVCEERLPVRSVAPEDPCTLAPPSRCKLEAKCPIPEMDQLLKKYLAARADQEQMEALCQFPLQVAHFVRGVALHAYENDIEVVAALRPASQPKPDLHTFGLSCEPKWVTAQKALKNTALTHDIAAWEASLTIAREETKGRMEAYLEAWKKHNFEKHLHDHHLEPSISSATAAFYYGQTPCEAPTHDIREAHHYLQYFTAPLPTTESGLRFLEDLLTTRCTFEFKTLWKAASNAGKGVKEWNKAQHAFQRTFADAYAAKLVARLTEKIKNPAFRKMSDLLGDPEIAKLSKFFDAEFEAPLAKFLERNALAGVNVGLSGKQIVSELRNSGWDPDGAYLKDKTEQILRRIRKENETVHAQTPQLKITFAALDFAFAKVSLILTSYNLFVVHQTGFAELSTKELVSLSGDLSKFVGASFSLLSELHPGAANYGRLKTITDLMRNSSTLTAVMKSGTAAPGQAYQELIRGLTKEKIFRDEARELARSLQADRFRSMLAPLSKNLLWNLAKGFGFAASLFSAYNAYLSARKFAEKDETDLAVFSYVEAGGGALGAIATVGEVLLKYGALSSAAGPWVTGLAIASAVIAIVAVVAIACWTDHPITDWLERTPWGVKAKYPLEKVIDKYFTDTGNVKLEFVEDNDEIRVWSNCLKNVSSFDLKLRKKDDSSVLTAQIRTESYAHGNAFVHYLPDFEQGPLVSITTSNGLWPATQLETEVDYVLTVELDPNQDGTVNVTDSTDYVVPLK